MRRSPVVITRSLLALAIAAGAYQISSSAQDRLATMPGHDRYQTITAESRDAVKTGALNVTWTGATAFEYARDGKLYRYDLTTRKEMDAGEAPEAAGRGGRGGRGRGGQGMPERGRQFESAESPDKKLKAVYRDRNVWLVDVASGAETQITTDGNEKERIKNGTASWVYGEELGQRTAMWWSPDGRKLDY